MKAWWIASAKLCGCGCGAVTGVAPYTRPNRGWTKGQPMAFLRGHNFRVGRGPGVYRKVPHVPGRMAATEHVAIAERALGKPLPAGVHVHHVDGNKRNNANGNLVICQDQTYHLLLHYRTRVLRAGGNPNTDKVCSECRRPRPLEMFTPNRSNKSSGRGAYCRPCAVIRQTALRRQRLAVSL